MTLEEINQQIIRCQKCSRLVAWCEKVAREKTRRFTDWDYWGKPIPGFGDVQGRLWIIGLAPAAHGGNRTGRIFTGDRSGDWLFRALYKAGFANQPQSTSRGDGLSLKDCYISALIRCAPPGNKPSRREMENCRSYLQQELQMLRRLKVILCLGQLSFFNTLQILEERQIFRARPRPKFQHGLMLQISGSLYLAASYHPSQQNTFTGRLTEEMFDAVFAHIREVLNN